MSDKNYIIDDMVIGRKFNFTDDKDTLYLIQKEKPDYYLLKNGLYAVAVDRDSTPNAAIRELIERYRLELRECCEVSDYLCVFDFLMDDLNKLLESSPNGGDNNG